MSFEIQKREGGICREREREINTIIQQNLALWIHVLLVGKRSAITMQLALGNLPEAFEFFLLTCSLWLIRRVEASFSGKARKPSRNGTLIHHALMLGSSSLAEHWNQERSVQVQQGD